MKVWLSLTHGISHDAVVHTYKNTYKNNNIWWTTLQMKTEEPARIQYKCLVPIYVSRYESARPRYLQNRFYIVLAPSFHIHVSVSNL